MKILKEETCFDSMERTSQAIDDERRKAQELKEQLRKANSQSINNTYDSLELSKIQIDLNNKTVFQK